MNLDIKPEAQLNTPHEIQSPATGHSKPECTSSSSSEVFLKQVGREVNVWAGNWTPAVRAGEKTSIAVVQPILWSDMFIKSGLCIEKLTSNK